MEKWSNSTTEIVFLWHFFVAIQYTDNLLFSRIISSTLSHTQELPENNACTHCFVHAEQQQQYCVFIRRSDIFLLEISSFTGNYLCVIVLAKDLTLFHSVSLSPSYKVSIVRIVTHLCLVFALDSWKCESRAEHFDPEILPF